MGIRVGGGIQVGSRNNSFSHIPRKFREEPVPPPQQQEDEIEEQEQSYPVSDRAIHIGYKLHPRTGKRIGDALIYLPKMRRRNEAMVIFGAPGSGKSSLTKVILNHFVFKEGRSVVIIDPKSDEWWSVREANRNPEMVKILRNTFHKSPVFVPEVDVYVPGFTAFPDEFLKENWHMTKKFIVKTSSLTAGAYLNLAKKEGAGTNYARKLEEILRVPKNKITIKYIAEELEKLEQSGGKNKQSAESLSGVFSYLCNMGIISDIGTDVRKEMLHRPRRDKNGNPLPGKVSIISLGAAENSDTKRDAIVSAVVEDIFKAAIEDKNLRPVLIYEEQKEFCPDDAKLSKLHYEAKNTIMAGHDNFRKTGVTRIHIAQREEQIPESLYDPLSTPYRIDVSTELTLRDEYGDPFLKRGVGLAVVKIRSIGDKAVPVTQFLAECMPSPFHHEYDEGEGDEL